MKRLPPYPVFPGEKYVGLGYKYMLADEEAPLLAINRVLCLVEYREDGSSKNMFRQYVRNPRGFAFLRKEGDEAPAFRARRFMEAVHYVSASLLARHARFLQESPASVPDAGGRALRNSADVPDYHEKQKQRMTGI